MSKRRRRNGGRGFTAGLKERRKGAIQKKLHSTAKPTSQTCRAAGASLGLTREATCDRGGHSGVTSLDRDSNERVLVTELLSLTGSRVWRCRATRGAQSVQRNCRVSSITPSSCRGVAVAEGGGGRVICSERPPSKLTVRQSQIIEGLIATYVSDTERMARDMKLNPFQLTTRQLEKHITSFKYWGRREVCANAAMNLKKLRWYNDPLTPQTRRYIQRH